MATGAIKDFVRTQMGETSFSTFNSISGSSPRPNVASWAQNVSTAATNPTEGIPRVNQTGESQSSTKPHDAENRQPAQTGLFDTDIENFDKSTSDGSEPQDDGRYEPMEGVSHGQSQSQGNTTRTVRMADLNGLQQRPRLFEGAETARMSKKGSRGGKLEVGFEDIKADDHDRTITAKTYSTPKTRGHSRTKSRDHATRRSAATSPEKPRPHRADEHEPSMNASTYFTPRQFPKVRQQANPQPFGFSAYQLRTALRDVHDEAHSHSLPAQQPRRHPQEKQPGIFEGSELDTEAEDDDGATATQPDLDRGSPVPEPQKHHHQHQQQPPPLRSTPAPASTTSILSRPAEADESELDHPLPHLLALPFSSLLSEPFDAIPSQTPPSILPPSHASAPLPLQLSYVLHLPPDQQNRYFTSVSTSTWEECGDWFTEQFALFVEKRKELRMRKRTVAMGFEEEIRRREATVRTGIAGVEKVVGAMRRGGAAVLGKGK